MFACVLIAGMGACKEASKGLQQHITGRMNELLVVAEKNYWNGPVGDTIRAFFGQDVAGLPQAEPAFDMLNLPAQFFDKNLKNHRNVLEVTISPAVDSTVVEYYDSPWAKTQKFVRIRVSDEKEFYRVFDENKLKIMGIYAKAEQDRLVAVYRRTADVAIYNLFKNKYHILLSAPSGYYVNKDTTGFVWLSSETSRDSKGVVFFTDDYEHESQFNDVVMIDRVNEMLEKFIPGPLDGNVREVSGPQGRKKITIRSFMAVDTSVPYSVIPYKYNGHYAVLIRGLWTVTNDFMAGPFVLNAVLDEERGRIIYMMGYVYYPNNEKRNMMKQVEAVMNTMTFDYRDEGGKKK